MPEAFPDGIGEEHLSLRPGMHRRSGWVAVGVLGLVLSLAMLGLFGGGSSPVQRVSGDRAELEFKAPQILRNGEVFEMRINATARGRLESPVIAVSAAYWHDLTINSLIPAPVSEGFEGGYYIFGFDPLAPGQTLALKVDGQINPPMFAGTEGMVELRDGRQLIARMPARLRVLP